MDEERASQLFTDDWRDPSDDCERGMYYLLMFAGLVGGVALAIGSGHELIHETTCRWLYGLGILLGAGISASCAGFLWHESKYWDLRRLSLERFVAGGFLFGFALILLAVRFPQLSNGQASDPRVWASAGIVLIVGGVADILFFLFFGLVAAYWPRFANRKRVVSSAYVLDRYVVDGKGNNIGDFPFFNTPDCYGIVRLRVDGKVFKAVTSPTAYDLAEPGALGNAIMRGKRLASFQVHVHATSAHR